MARNYDDEINFLKVEKQYYDDQAATLSSIFDQKKKIQALDEAHRVQEAILTLELKKQEKIIKAAVKNNGTATDTQKEALKIAKDNLINSKENLKVDKQRVEQHQKIKDLLISQTKLEAVWIKGLMDSDKIIRQTILNLGMSGVKAEMIRTSFENSAMSVAEMGGSLVDVQQVMQGFADETGRARVMSEQMIVDIVKIGRGTGLGVENATKMAAQFELMGVDAQTTFEMTEKFVHSSEKYGINTAKALKNVNENFKKLNLYNFKGGVAGMMKMSAYATKMNVDFSQAFNAIDTAKTLEGAIGLAASLQVMGGEFAKSDPFEMLFLSRNDPAKFTEKINEMTKGVVTFQRQADGSFSKFISPADRDRMASVEKSLGLQNGELTQQALRMADISKMRRNMLGSGMSKENKDAIEGSAIFNSKSGQFQVIIGTTAKNISDLTKSEADLFIQQKATLEQRAKDSLTFEEALQATLASFKTILLPMLRGVNDVMQFFIPKFQAVAKWFKENINHDFLKAAGIITGAAVLLNGGVTALSKIVYIASGRNMLGGTSLGRGARATRNAGSAMSGAGGLGGGIGGAGNANVGKGLMRGGLGVGAAAAGVGAGIGVAALGISQLASAIKDVDSEKLTKLNWTIGIIGVTMIGMGVAAAFATAPVAAFGLAALGIGAGIGVAAAGIGYMAEGFSKMIDSAKGSEGALLGVASGIGAIGLAMGGAGIGMIGGIGLLATLGAISAYAPKIEKIGTAFKEINTALAGNASDYEAIANVVASISKMNTKSGSAFAELATLLSKPLKVEFADKDVTMKANITLDIDGERFTAKAINIPILINRMKSYERGKS